MFINMMSYNMHLFLTQQPRWKDWRLFASFWFASLPITKLVHVYRLIPKNSFVTQISVRIKCLLFFLGFVKIFFNVVFKYRLRDNLFILMVILIRTFSWNFSIYNFKNSFHLMLGKFIFISKLILSVWISISF